jgi:hypothetical protein
VAHAGDGRENIEGFKTVPQTGLSHRYAEAHPEGLSGDFAFTDGSLLIFQAFDRQIMWDPHRGHG